jgi:hypothetical protein
MTPEEREKMQILCLQIAVEQDHGKFTKLIQQLNELLDDKANRLPCNPPTTPPQL